MGRSEDFEFVDDVTDTSVADEVMEIGRGGLGRVAVGVLAALTIAGTAVAVNRAAHHLTTVAVPRPVALPAQPQPLGSALPIGPTAVFDVALMGGRVYALQVGRLAALDLQTNRIVAQAAISDAAFAAALRLVADPAAGRIWVIALGDAPALIEEFDARTLHPIRASSWPAPISSVAILDGTLYLASSGIVAWAPGAAAPQIVAPLRTQHGPIAADPTRHRLLLLQAGLPTKSFSYHPGGALRPGAPLAVTKGQFVVVNGVIWLGGFAVTGAPVFAPINPVTLSAGTNRDVVVDLGLGANVAAAGQSVVWLRNGSGTGSLWCVDARDGRILNTWGDAPGSLASMNGEAFLATGSAILSLVLGRCTG